MKNINIIFVLSFLFIAQASFAQNNFKIGPSMLVNLVFLDINKRVATPLGGEISYEFGLSDRFSVNLAGNIHYGEQESDYWENHLNNFKQKNLLIGSQFDVRYHFKGLYQGAYVGVGGDVKYFNSKNYWEAKTDGDPKATFSDYEYNAGVAFGTYVPLKHGALNPNFYLGGELSQYNEYIVHAK